MDHISLKPTRETIHKGKNHRLPSGGILAQKFDRKSKKNMALSRIQFAFF